MPDRLIVSADDTIKCPRCEHEFRLDEGLARQTIEKYGREFDDEMRRRADEFRERISEEEQRRAQSETQVEIERLNKLANQRAGDVARLEADLKKAREAGEKHAEERLGEEQARLKQELTEKDEKLKEYRDQELHLRNEKRKLEEAQQEFDIQLGRRVDEEKAKLEERIRGTEADRFRLIELDYKKKIDDAQQANEDLRRKLEQGSGQLHGEVLELELERELSLAFPFDRIEPVKKGARGADVLQGVRARTGQEVGTILWESKRAETFSNSWIQKLKDDQRATAAGIAVLVTTSMPKATNEPFLFQDGVWVVTVPAVRSVAEVLRVVLLESARQRAVSDAREEKKGAVFEYLCSVAFSQKIRASVEAAIAIKSELESERNAMARIWKKREQQAERIVQSIMALCGDLQGIAQESLPELAGIGLLPSAETPESGE
jgi:hypothetical protein